MQLHLGRKDVAVGQAANRLEKLQGPLKLAMLGSQQHLVAERGQPGLAPLAQLAGGESIIVMPQQGLQCRGVRLQPLLRHGAGMLRRKQQPEDMQA